MKRIGRLITTVIFFASALLISGCGGGGGGGGDGGSSNPGFVLWGTISPAVTTKVYPVGFVSAKGTITGCDGPYSTCCSSDSDCTPGTALFRVYKVWLSQNEDCSDPILVGDNGAAPERVDFVTTAQLFTATPPDGEYYCLIIKMDDTIYFTTNQESEDILGSDCATGQTYTFDTFREGDETLRWDMEQNGTVAASGTRENPATQVTYYYITTNTSAPPSNISQYQIHELLNGPIVVDSGSTTNAYFVVDMTNRVAIQLYNNSNYCQIASPTAEVIVQ